MKTMYFGKKSSFFKKVTSLLLNKYILAFTLFAIWVMFFDKNALVTQVKLVQTINRLEHEKVFLLEEIEVTKRMKEDLTNNQEKYAREKYYMKKPGERIYIVE